MLAFAIGLIIGLAGGALTIGLCTVCLINRLEYLVEEKQLYLDKIQAVLLDTIADADYLLNVGIYGSTKEASKRVTTMREKVICVLGEYYSSHVTM